jgi:hypothetical protein
MKFFAVCMGMAVAIASNSVLAGDNGNDNGNGNSYGNGGNKNCPSGFVCRKDRYNPHPQGSSYPVDYFTVMFPGIFHYPNPTSIRAAQGRGLEYDDGVFFSIVSVFTAEFGHQEITRLIRTNTHFLAACWNSQTFFHRNVSPLLYSPSVNFPFVTSPILDSMNTTVNRNLALAFAAARITEYLIPGSTTVSTVMRNKFSVDTSYQGMTRLDDARDIGNIAAAATIAYAKNDGWNQEGSDYPIWKHPYSDYSRWVPTNDAYELKNVAEWQPLVETADDGAYSVQQHLTPQVGSGRPFALSEDDLEDYDEKGEQARWLRHSGSQSDPLTAQELALLKTETDIILQASANLNEEKKMVAQLFDNKLYTYGFMALNSWMDPTYNNMKVLALSVGKVLALYDATVVAWRQKMKINAVRPVNAVRYIYGNSQVTAYAGPYQGTKTFSGSDWNSYLRTQAHSDNPSGTTCYCAAFAEFANNYLNTPGQINLRWDFAPGSSVREPGVVPSNWIVKTFDTPQNFLRECAESRVNAGVHFNKTVYNTMELCKGIGNSVWEKIYPKIRAVL